MRRLSFAVLGACGCAATSRLRTAIPRRTRAPRQERRAVEAVIWGMPAVNTELMHDEMIKAGGKPGRDHLLGQAARLA